MKLEFTDGFVRAAGHRYYWKSIGEPSKGSILCLHGGPGTSHWATVPMSDLAPRGYRVVMFDQLGCGRSDHPRSFDGYNVRQAADEVDAVRRGLRLGRCHLWGYSYGGALALQTILRHPNGYRSLIVSSGYASQREVDREAVRLVRALPLRFRRAIERNEARGTLRNPAYQRAVAEFLYRHLSDSKVAPYEVAIGLANRYAPLVHALVGDDERVLSPAAGSMAGWDVRDQLGRIRVPTLITVGGHDHVTPRCARTIQRGVRRSRLVVFPESGHNHVFRERARFMATVLEFLTRVAG